MQFRWIRLALLAAAPCIAGCAALQPEPRFARSEPPPERTVPSSPSKRLPTWQTRLALELRRYLGSPYVWGGTSPAGVDCSGLVVAVYGAALGLELPHSVAELYRVGKPVERHELKVGDLVFFRSRPASREPDHVGVYVGRGLFVHASPSEGVTVSELSRRGFQDGWAGARRLSIAPEGPPVPEGDR